MTEEDFSRTGTGTFRASCKACARAYSKAWGVHLGVDG